jgi:pyrroloquinoline quinone biosynthesis protein B
MKVRVLGSAAGGGFPQWNCNCLNCSGLRAGTLAATPRTQSSIALSSDGRDWVLFNASPDLPAQIRSFPALQPGRSLRDSGISGVVLMDAQLDHTLGLLTLREGKRLRIWCTEPVRLDLTHSNPIFPILEHYCGVDWQRIGIEPGSSFEVPELGSVRFRAIAIDSNAPPYSPRRDHPEPGDNIGVQMTDSSSGKSLFYAPGLGALGPELRACLEQADVLLVDGTFWTDDELLRLGVSTRRARDMGHLPQSGAGGMLELLEGLRASRKILIHINNTNPILDEASPERERLARSGIEVAHDGMEFEV